MRTKNRLVGNNKHLKNVQISKELILVPKMFYRINLHYIGKIDHQKPIIIGSKVMLLANNIF